MQQYELLGVVGQGQFGTAHKARHKGDNQLYCLKRIPMTSKDDHSGALREAQLLSTLDHPNIIAYKESFMDKDGSLCIVTSFCDEGDLFNKIRKKATQKQFFTESEIMDMFIQTASALHYIHGKKILHRDLKTQNIFLAKGGIIKLGDFGISKVLEKTDQFATTVTGTPYYMAPEICTNQPYTFKSDIWSLGCVLYEMCTLKHAFAADSLLSLVFQIVRGTFPPIPSDMFSQGLSDLVNSLLVRDTAVRPSLGQLFQQPFIQKNVNRFRADEQKRVLKTNSVGRRRAQLLEEEKPAGDEDQTALTPKQKMERKKQAERERREMELKIASLNMQKDKNDVAARKHNMVHSSNIGLSNNPASTKHSSNNALSLHDDDTPNLGTVGSTQSTPRMPGRQKGSMWDMDSPPSTSGRASARTGHGAHHHPDHDDTVNMSTMPTMPTMPGTRGASAATQRARAGAPVRPPSSMLRNSTLWDGDDVLMGSAQPSTLGNTVDVYGATARSGVPLVDPYGATVVTPVHGHRPRKHGDSVNHLAMNTGTHTMGSTVLMGSVNPSQLGQTNQSDMVNLGTMPIRTLASTSSSAATHVPVVGAFRFGIADESERAQSPFAPVKSDSPTALDRSQVKFGHSTESRPRGSFDYIKNKGQQPHQDHDHAYSDDFDEHYSDDFEEDEDGQTVNQDRTRIIKNVAEMNSFEDEAKGSIALVQDKMSTITKNDKSRALRDKGKDMLGAKFDAIYDYLRRVRAGPASVDEKEVQKKLLELVGDRSKMQGCFLVDQLVFQESMYK